MILQIFLSMSELSVNIRRKSFKKFCKIHKNPAGIYLLKGNKRNLRARCHICSKLKYCSNIIIVNFEQVNAVWESICFVESFLTKLQFYISWGLPVNLINEQTRHILKKYDYVTIPRKIQDFLPNFLVSKLDLPKH